MKKKISKYDFLIAIKKVYFRKSTDYLEILRDSLSLIIYERKIDGGYIEREKDYFKKGFLTWEDSL